MLQLVKLWPYMAIALLLAVAGERHFQLRLMKAERDAHVVTIAARDAAIETLNATRLTAEEIGQFSAQACKSTMRTQVRHTQEAETIREAPKDRGAAAAKYRSLLCRRPEAAKHPACSPSVG